MPRKKAPKRTSATRDDAQKPPLILRITLGDRAPVVVDVNKLNFGERAELEDFHDRPWAQIAGGGWLFSDKGAAFLAWLGYRRRSPELTLAEVFEATEIKLEINPDDLLEEGGEGKESSPATSGTDAS
jgi:hypothetical protein